MGGASSPRGNLHCELISVFICLFVWTGGGRMLWLLLSLLPMATCSQVAVQDVTYKDDSGGGGGLGDNGDDDHSESPAGSHTFLCVCAKHFIGPII